MSLAGLVLRNVAGNRLRSLLVVLCVALAAGFATGGALVVRGAETGLRLGVQRLGADIVVVPETAEGEFASALLTGANSTATFPAATLAQVAGVDGVAAASPQLFLGPVPVRAGETTFTASLVAFDPATDFTVQPWLAQGGPAPLAVGEAIAGSELGALWDSTNSLRPPPYGNTLAISLPTLVVKPHQAGYSGLHDQVASVGQRPRTAVTVAGMPLAVAGTLAPTGTALDRTLFISFATAAAVRDALRLADPPVVVPFDAYSAVLVKARPESDFRLLAPHILRAVPGALPVESPGMFRALQKQLAGLAQGALVALVLGSLLAAATVGIAFSLAADERRCELAVLRALGATRRFVLGSILAEASALALAGGALGALVAGGFIYALRGTLSHGLGVPFALPTPAEGLLLFATALVLSSLVGALAALLPALGASRADLALAARE